MNLKDLKPGILCRIPEEKDPTMNSRRFFAGVKPYTGGMRPRSELFEVKRDTVFTVIGLTEYPIAGYGTGHDIFILTPDGLGHLALGDNLIDECLEVVTEENAISE